MANRRDLVMLHEAEVHEDAQRLGESSRRRQREEEEEGGHLCPRCQERIAGSLYQLNVHMERCVPAVGNVELDLGEGWLVEDDRGEMGKRHDENVVQMRFPVHLEYPAWHNEAQIGAADAQHLLLPLGDAMLQYSLLGAGHFGVSDGTLNLLLKLLATPTFQQCIAEGQISKTLHELRQHQHVCDVSAKWQEIVKNSSTFYVRDLRDVVREFLGDRILLESLEFDGRTESTTRQDTAGLRWGSHWTSFSVYQTRKRQVQEEFGEDCYLLSFGLWLDSGETDRFGSSSIYIVVLAPLNAPLSLARRSDCVFPIAYIYNDGDIVDTLRYLLPQLVSLRKPRDIVWIDGSKRKVSISVDMLSGDHPAVTKILGTVMTASSNFPCKVCMISKRDDSEPLNDCNRWRAALHQVRTQEEAETAIRRMSAGEARQPETGMREEFTRSVHPMFEYFRGNGAMADAFVCTISDTMHDLYLGLYKECFRALANEVIEGGNVAIRKFKGATLALSLPYIFGMDATIFRAGDVRETSKTDLLHLLQNGSLYAREYQSLAPLLLILFDSVEMESVSRAVIFMAGLVSYGALLEAREWPLDALQSWWDDLRNFAIDCYEGFQRVLIQWLPKSANLVKVHDVLCHALRAHQLHGPFLKTQGFEGLFRMFQQFTTNGKNVGKQLFGKMLEHTEAARWISGDSEHARDVANLTDSTLKDEEREAGDCKKDLEDRVVAFMERYCAAHDLSLIKCPKWISLSQAIDRGGALRGPRKMYAAPSFHGKAKFDVVEFGQEGEERYMLLQGIALVANNQRAHITHLLLCGIDLLEVAKKGQSIGYRMPIVPKTVNARLSIRQFVPQQFLPIMAIPNILSLHDEQREDFSYVRRGNGEIRVPFSRQEQVFYINVFATHGEARYCKEWRWLPAANGAV